MTFTVNSENQCQEIYQVTGHCVVRYLILPNGRKISSEIAISPTAPMNENPQSIFDYSFLRLKEKPKNSFSEVVSIVDLFSGCGCLSLGAMEAATAIGKKFTPLLAIDKDAVALAVYNDNFKPAKTYSKDICALIDGAIGAEETPNETELRRGYLGNVVPTLVLAGPPCQGYSSLNNFHRQTDDRNVLYERVGRFVELTSPQHVLIENVPTVIHSADNVVERTISLLETMGYFVDSDVINLAHIGVPQLRKRHVVIASKKHKISIKQIIEKHHVEFKRTFEWAAGDIQEEFGAGLLGTQTKHSEENIRRIKYLHDNGIYDLPNAERPKCHQKEHGYKSMYGRIRADEPAQTVTSGFTSPGQGRYIHPAKVRTITPHEAARLQMIPDYFDFAHATSRRSLSLMIGNAAPLKLSYVFCLELLT
jgi:DNA (cytosine-5)-methyltransferase 1